MPATTSAESAAALSLVLQRLRRDGDRLFGSRRIEIAAVAVQVRESSTVARLRVSTSAGDRYVFAKVLRPRHADEAASDVRTRLRHDFDVTQRAFETMWDTPDVCAVEPLVCYEDALCIVTKEAPGVPLDRMTITMARWPATVPRLAPLEAAVRRVGNWIASFQRFASPEPSDCVDVQAIREYIDVRLNKLVAIPFAAFTERDRTTVLAHVDRLAGRVSSNDLLAVPTHGDITPSNIVVAPDRITVLDFAMTARGSKYVDLARMYTQLDFYGSKPQYRPGVIGRLQRALLSGFEPALRSDHPLFEIHALQHVVCHFLSHARQPGGFPSNLYSLRLCRRHASWLRGRAHQRDIQQGAAHDAVAAL